MRMAIVRAILSKQLCIVRTMAVMYDDSLELAMRRQGYGMSNVKVLADEEITDIVLLGERKILKRV